MLRRKTLQVIKNNYIALKPSLLDEQELLRLVKAMYKGVRKFGVKRIEIKLKGLFNSKERNNSTLVSNRIFKEITTAYGISKGTLITTNNRGKTTEAKVMAMILHYKHADMTQDDVAALFLRVTSLVHRRLRSFDYIITGGKQNRPRHHATYSKVFHQITFMPTYREIEKRIVIFKENLNKPPDDDKRQEEKNS